MYQMMFDEVAAFSAPGQRWVRYERQTALLREIKSCVLKQNMKLDPVEELLTTMKFVYVHIYPPGFVNEYLSILERPGISEP